MCTSPLICRVAIRITNHGSPAVSKLYSLNLSLAYLDLVELNRCCSHLSEIGREANGRVLLSLQYSSLIQGPRSLDVTLSDRHMAC
jgi:hypothetical protein